MPQRPRYDYNKADRYRNLILQKRATPKQIAWLRSYEASKAPHSRQSDVQIPDDVKPSPEGSPPPAPPSPTPAASPQPPAPAQGPPPLPLDTPAAAGASGVEGTPGAIPSDLGAAFEGKTPEDLKKESALTGLGVREAVEGMYCQFMLGWSQEIKAQGGTPLPDAMITFGGKCAGVLAEKYGMLYLGEDAALGLAAGLPVAWGWNESRKLEKRRNAALPHPAQNPYLPQHQVQHVNSAPGRPVNGHQQQPQQPQPAPAPAPSSDGWRSPDGA